MSNLCRLIATSLLISLVTSVQSQNTSTNGCTFHQTYSCHPYAKCVDINILEDSWKCVCPPGSDGDGLQGPDHTGCGVKKCAFTSECHTKAVCNEMAECACKKGYAGDGWYECLDQDECSVSPCNEHATCENTEGSFICKCNMAMGYVGDGFSCQHTCQMDYDCESNEKCVAEICVCNAGFQIGQGVCVDINECDTSKPCSVNADCNNTIGSYKCTCKNGYSGNGQTCALLPRNCHEIKMANPSAASNRYDIDTDGTGPLNAITVNCLMRTGLGITSIEPTQTGSVLFKQLFLFQYSYTQTLYHIKAIIGNSGYCAQAMSFQCYSGAKLLDGNDYWKNGNGDNETNWGGASKNNMCACGQLGYCSNRTSNCNCDGVTTTTVDSGKIIDKYKLPILAVSSVVGSGYAYVKIGPVLCAPVSFDNPFDCHDAKFNPLYKITTDGPQVLDFDGPDGVLAPVIAYCIMQSWKHVGVTVIPHETPYPMAPTVPGPILIQYLLDHIYIVALMGRSFYCSQEAGYQCQNSRLLNNGDKKGYFSDTSGNAKDYWPGGMGETNMCGCGLTGTCALANYKCNCDIYDGVIREDFGTVITKADLPFGKFTFSEIGSFSLGRLTVGPLMCSTREFGIPATCQDYVNGGANQSHTYIIDPDGPYNPSSPNSGNQPPFPVYCKIIGSPAYAITVLNHNYPTEQTKTTNGTLVYVYRRVNNSQLGNLIFRSVFCTQSWKMTCLQAPIHTADKNLTTWTTRDNRVLSYFAGNGSNGPVCSCGLTKPTLCTSGGRCECDKADNVSRYDVGQLINKNDLPIMSMTVTVHIEARIEVGPLECSALFPNCAELKLFDNKYRLESENPKQNGIFTIDADGPLSLPPFAALCTGTKTEIQINSFPTNPAQSQPENPVSICYNLRYTSNGIPVSPAQIQALVAISTDCAQAFYTDCQNAPRSGHSNFSTCDGTYQTGWAGSKGQDMCACGVTGSCSGGRAQKCNCDLEDGVLRSDGGWLVDKKQLAVCQVCVSLDPANNLITTPKLRSVKLTVSNLYCDSVPLGKGKSCQAQRNAGITQSGTLMIDPDVTGPAEAAPMFCSIQIYPPTGWTEIYPKISVINVPESGIDIKIEYYVYNMEIVYTLIQNSGYCIQELSAECHNSRLDLGGTFGWYSKNGILQTFWAGNNDGTSGCAGGQCQCNLGGIRRDGGLILDDSLLPIYRIVLGPASGTRILTIGPVKCFDIYKDCEDIRLNNAQYNLLGNGSYAIDPDQAGGVPHFAVVCNFTTNRGVTYIPVIQPSDTSVKNKSLPGSYVVPITYVAATYDQIHVLAERSGYCIQIITFVCYQSLLINFNDPAYTYYDTYGGRASNSFGVAGHSDINGCACIVTKTCPLDKSCHCDSMDMTVDYGFETNRSVLPLQAMHFGGQKNGSGSAIFHLTDVRCGPLPSDLPVNCHDAWLRGFRTGEVLIQPSPVLDPFLVYCNMDIVNNGGVTIIGNNLEVGISVIFNAIVTVIYYNAKSEQLDAITRVSIYCYQPFKYACRNTKMLSGNGFFQWTGGMINGTEMFVGNGRSFARECNCGREGLCGGSENKSTLISLNRPCNCDAADDQIRIDAGVFNYSTKLPIKTFNFSNTGIPGAYGFVTLGKLYCSNKDFDIDECNTGFHDCHKNAWCINKFGNYECQCIPGWRGHGRPDVLANGRNCYDDDECAMQLCPWSANCKNLPGSYECTCKDGFKQISKRICEDIDECALGIHNCSKNARCVNLVGSYNCRCNRNYRGDGFDCKSLAVCTCFGDPHCILFDGGLLHFQGPCQYVMSRDKCDNINSTPTYELLTTHYQREVTTTGDDAAWIKEVTFKISGYSITLMQGHEVRVNGLTTNIPYRTLDFNIEQVGKYTEMVTTEGIEILWDGEEAAEIYIPSQFWGKTCGLCGNFSDNPLDDFEVGPKCPELQGQITDNHNVFGDSWMATTNMPEQPTCIANCTSSHDSGVCTGMKYQMAKLLCDKVWSRSGRFKDCILQMDDNIVQHYYLSCIYDLCRLEGDAEISICYSAADLVDCCSKTYGVNVTSFRSKDFCDITCEENMMYTSCGPASVTTCWDYLTASTGNNRQSTVCKEGCFCKNGYIMEGGKCVLPEHCGCIYQEMYYKVGDEIVMNECGQRAMCKDDGSMLIENITCHEKADCALHDGRYGCHCQEGYYGDGSDCREDECLKSPCGLNETCVRNMGSDVGYDCICQMGFVGDCGNCTEINECLTGTHTCPENSQCINTVGSFKCQCYEGFNLYAGKCQDIDECELAKNSGQNVCGNHSRCANKNGGYECLCCAGYQQNINKICVESKTLSTIDRNAPSCCVCDIAICNRPGQVCGEDGKQYNNIRDMIIANCELGLPPNKHVQVDYYGPCQSKCADNLCPKYQRCITNDKTGKPTCICDDCTYEETISVEQVCTDKLDVYPNMCVFMQIQCMLDQEAVPLPNMIPCDGKDGAQPVGPWGPWSPCSVTCGKGTRTKSRTAYRPLSIKEQETYPIQLSTDCYEDPCQDGPCASFKCEIAAEECTVNKDNEPVCECPTCKNIGVESVCGYVSGLLGGVTQGTWQSACHLQKFACEKRVYDYEAMHPGPCGVQPLNCTRVPNAQYIRGGDNLMYMSSQKVNVFECDGGCGSMKSFCCQPSRIESVSIQLENVNQDPAFVDTQVPIIKECQCVDIGKAHRP